MHERQHERQHDHDRFLAPLDAHQIASGSNNPSTLPLLSANEPRWTPAL